MILTARKKCDSVKPKCSACLRLQLDCEYKEQKVVWQINKLKDDGSTESLVESTSRRVVIPVSRSASIDTTIADPTKLRTKEWSWANSSKRTAKQKDSRVEEVKLVVLEVLESGGSGAEVGDAKDAKKHHPNSTAVHENRASPAPGHLPKLPSSPWSISNFLVPMDEFNYPSPSLETIFPRAKKHDDYTDIEEIPRAVEPYFKANITSEVYLTYNTNVSHSLWGHRFNLPKFVSVELAEILLSYFCEEMAPKFSVCRKHSSSLVCTYLPLAAYDTMVLAALLAWATLHFEKNGDLQFPTLKERLLKDVQQSLNKISVNGSNIPVEVTLATLLIMIAIENKGTSSNWVPYYKMAQQLIKSSNPNKHTEDFDWLKNNLVYHEVTAPSLLMLEDNPEDLESYFKYSETFDDLPEAYMGICRSIYKINRDIFRLSRKLVTSSSIEVLEEVCREAEVLEQRIENCKTLEPTEEMVLNGTLMYHRMFFTVLKDTARLYIRQCVYMVAPVSIKSTMLVGRIMNTIKKLFGTVIDPALLFPLFILGVDTVTKYVRDWVIGAMKDLHKRVGSGNILVAIELLEKIWEQNNEGRIHVLWPQVAKEHGLLVSLA